LQCGNIRLRKTIDNITFYEMGGKWYARKKSSLSGARVKKDPRFRKTMEHAGFFTRGSKIGAAIYRSLPREEREHGLYRKLVGMATTMLKSGRTEAEILDQLQQFVLDGADAGAAVHGYACHNTPPYTQRRPERQLNTRKMGDKQVDRLYVSLLFPIPFLYPSYTYSIPFLYLGGIEKV